MEQWQIDLRSVRDAFQHASSPSPDLWYGIFRVFGDIPEEGVHPVEIVMAREPLTRKRAYELGPARRHDGGVGHGFLFGDYQALEQFKSLGNTAYIAVSGSPRKDITDSLPPPKSPRQRFPRWLDVLSIVAGQRLSPLVSIRESTIDESLDDWTAKDATRGFVHVNSAFLEQNVFTASVAALGVLIGTAPAYADTTPVTAATPTPDKQGAGKNEKGRNPVSAKAIESLLGAEAQRIMTIAAQTDIPLEEKMRAICRIDQRFRGYNSSKWAELLGVTPNRIRQLPFWTQELRKGE
jgi:hypothetical protein